MTDDPHDPVVGSADPAAAAAAAAAADAVADDAAAAAAGESRTGGAGLDADSGRAASRLGSGSGRRRVAYLVAVTPDSADPESVRSGPAPAGQLGDDVDDEPTEREDWAWVQEWRAGQESTPWATGIALTAFSALVVGVAVWVLSAGLVDRPVVAILVNLLVAGGLVPAIWLSRRLPVLRWIAAGAAAGIVIGWVCAVLMLPYPSP